MRKAALLLSDAEPLLAQVPGLAGQLDDTVRPEILCLLAQTCVELGDRERAEHLIVDIPAWRVEKYDALQQVGIALAQRGDLLGARRLALSASADDQSHGAIVRAIAFESARIGLVDQARTMFAEITRQKTDAPWVLDFIAEAHTAALRWDEAIKVIDGIADEPIADIARRKLIAALLDNNNDAGMVLARRMIAACLTPRSSTGALGMSVLAATLASHGHRREACAFLRSAVDRCALLDNANDLLILLAQQTDLGDDPAAERTYLAVQPSLTRDKLANIVYPEPGETLVRHLYRTDRRNVALNLMIQLNSVRGLQTAALIDARAGNADGAKSVLGMLAGGELIKNPRRRVDFDIAFPAALATGGHYSAAIGEALSLPDVPEQNWSSGTEFDLTARDRALLEIAICAHRAGQTAVVTNIRQQLNRDIARDWLEADLARVEGATGNLVAASARTEAIASPRIRALTLIGLVRGIPRASTGTGEYYHPGRPLMNSHSMGANFSRALRLKQRITQT